MWCASGVCATARSSTLSAIHYLFDVTARHGAQAHFFADDGLLYTSLTPAALLAEVTIRCFVKCLEDVDN